MFITCRCKVWGAPLGVTRSGTGGARVALGGEGVLSTHCGRHHRAGNPLEAPFGREGPHHFQHCGQRGGVR